MHSLITSSLASLYNHMGGLFVYVPISCFIAWIWIDYFRLIEVYGNEKLKYILLTFFMGAASLFLVLGADKYVLDYIPLELNQEPGNDALYCIFKIGVVEETAKMVPYFIMFLFFRKQFKEPIDYIAFAAFSALGFAAAEDVKYFIHHDGSIISIRAILTSVAHMFFSSLVGYGILTAKYRKLRFKFFRVAVYCAMAVFSHAFYDFWLIEGLGTVWALISIFFFLMGTSWYATMINNALNNASDFTYKRMVTADKVATRIFIYYAVVFVIQLIVNVVEMGALAAFASFQGTVYVLGIILSGKVTRLSRFKFIQGRWQPIRIELPFRFRTGAGLHFAVKGDSVAASRLNQYYEEYITINALPGSVYLDKPRVAFIEKKLFLKYDETLHLARVYKDDTLQEFEMMLLLPKLKGQVMYSGNPIVALLRYTEIEGIDLTTLTSKNFDFIEWVCVKPTTIDNIPIRLTSTLKEFKQEEHDRFMPEQNPEGFGGESQEVKG